jgi:hypothetical protein
MQLTGGDLGVEEGPPMEPMTEAKVRALVRKTLKKKFKV